MVILVGLLILIHKMLKLGRPCDNVLSSQTDDVIFA
jgi:hypothetical protein